MKLRFLLPVILSATGVLGQSPGQANLRIHWEKGKVYRQQTQTDTTVPVPGTEAKQSMSVVQVTDMSIKGTKAGSEVTVAFASVRGEVTANGTTHTFDSTQPGEQNPALKQMFGSALGKSFVLVYDEKDRFKDIKGLERMSADPGALSTLEALASAREVADLYRKSMEMGLPRMPVSEGDTWIADETIHFPKSGEMQVKMNSKLAGYEDREGRRHAKISFEGKFGNTAPRPDNPAAAIDIAADSTINGILFFDMERRVVSFGTYSTRIYMQAGGQLIPFDQKITSKLVSITDRTP
jgi:Family of unknown function (DUF6263)